MMTFRKRFIEFCVILAAAILILPVICLSEEILYQYDAGNRLIQADYMGTAVSGYTYDNMGNRLLHVISDASSPTNNSPHIPSNPTPADGATGVLSASAFTWSGGDPDDGDAVFYHFKLWQDSTAPYIYTLIQEPSYAPRSLHSFATYSWQVIAKDSHHYSASSPIWQFTTGNNPPLAPEGVFPAQNDRSAYLFMSLSWFCGGDENPNDTVTYDLYLGKTNPPPLLESNLTSCSLFIDGRDKNIDTRYRQYWRVVARDNHGLTTQGEVKTLTFLDTDGDGLPDDLEADTAVCTDGADPDSDNDSLSDGEEDVNQNGQLDPGETNPCDNDTDNDGMEDGWEVVNGLDPRVNDAADDSDGDGVNNYTECIQNTDPGDNQSYMTSNRMEDFESGDFTKFFWRTDPVDGWRISPRDMSAGRYSARSGAIGDSQESAIETTMICEDGEISFFFTVSSEELDDTLLFYIDAVQQESWSGNIQNGRVSFGVTAGVHVFKWVYAKGASGTFRQDAAWIDDIMFPGEPDIDADGVIDGWELFYFNTLDQDLCADSDGDGLSDLESALVLADPIAGDNDGDGIPDLWESAHGLDQNDAEDALLDPDGDGFTNFDEYLGQSDPHYVFSIPRHVQENFETGDLTKFYWRSGGDGTWQVTTDKPYQSTYSAQAPLIGDGQMAALETSISCIKGPIAFWYSTSTEADGDELRFYIDGVLTGQWSGDHDYQQASFSVEAGVHVFRWEYVKNAADAEFEDTVWIDNITFPGTADSDADGVIDGWELFYFNTLDQDLCTDSNGDGFNDIKSAPNLGDPFSAYCLGDSDQDGDVDGADLQWLIHNLGGLWLGDFTVIYGIQGCP